MASDKNVNAPGMVLESSGLGSNADQDAQPGLAVINIMPAMQDFVEAEIGEIPFESKCASLVCCLLPVVGWLSLMEGVYTVNVREAVVLQHCGVLTGVVEEPGCYCTYPCGVEKYITSTKTRTMDIASAKVADGNGNPIMVSCIINYRVVDPKKAILNVEDLEQFVDTNTQAVLKQTVSHYTYDQLKSDYAHVNEQMRGQLQPLLVVAGVQVEAMNLNDLAYAPEVAAAMLKKQQAQALIAARTLIVQGACRIAQDAISLLEEGELKLDAADKVKIVTNLLTVTCSEGNATPTLGM